MTKINDHADMVRQAMTLSAKLDRDWMRSDIGHEDPHRYIPWLPFPQHAFIELLAEALPETTGNRFLEIGCGPGAKMILAETIFGLEVTGIERVGEYVKQAQEFGLNVIEADALTWDSYSGYDYVFLNRPFADKALEAQLERKVYTEVSSGTVVIAVNVEGPPSRSWFPVLDDGEVRRWISQKP